jgi:integrase/recombinase XerD
MLWLRYADSIFFFMDNLTAWDNNPVAAFNAFVVTVDFAETGRRARADGFVKALSRESAKTYSFMFGNFASWMREQGKTFSTLTEADLLRFVNQTVKGKRVLNSKIGHRYLRLLERCYEHLNVVPNPAMHALLAAERTELPGDQAGRTLSPEQLQRFFAALPQQPPRRRQVTGFDGWKRRRDRAMQVVIALAGLRVAEAIGLLVGEVGQQAALDGSIELTITPEEKHDTSYEHTTTLPREGVEELQAWLKERAAMVEQLQLPGDLVFPANLAGKKMTKKTVYVQFRATFERAGLNLSRSGGRTLRNTFAKQQLETGASPGELKDVLGLALERSAADYKLTRIREDPEQ